MGLCWRSTLYYDARSTNHQDTVGEEDSSIHSQPPYQKKVNGQFHSSANLPPGKSHPVAVEQAVGCIPGHVWTIWGTEKSIAPVGTRSRPLCRPIHGLVIIPTELYRLIISRYQSLCTFSEFNINGSVHRSMNQQI